MVQADPLLAQELVHLARVGGRVRLRLRVRVRVRVGVRVRGRGLQVRALTLKSE